MRGIAISSLLALLTASCTPDETIHGDVKFTSEERGSIERAAARWREFSGGNTAIRVVWDYDGPHVTAKGVTRMFRGSPPGQELSTQAGASGEGQIWLDPSKLVTIYEGEYRISLHEFGHHLGLTHVDDEQSIMYPYLMSGVRDLTEEHDLAECIRVGVCQR